MVSKTMGWLSEMGSCVGGHKCSDFGLNRFDLVYMDLKLGIIELGKLEYGSRDSQKRIEKIWRRREESREVFNKWQGHGIIQFSEIQSTSSTGTNLCKIRGGVPVTSKENPNAATANESNGNDDFHSVQDAFTDACSDENKRSSGTEYDSSTDFVSEPCTVAYDTPTDYDITYFRQTTDESFRGHSLPSPQEASSLHKVNSRLISPAPMAQQHCNLLHKCTRQCMFRILPILYRITNSYLLSMFHRCPCLGILAMLRSLTPTMAAVAC
ncbi:hypothetical protein Vadar_027352 [Vaccinium darrowii]|uniref:Uncharacterized protein n=1 Tax=Vaccinium darrowii TaxID=229202 RepID=A0ACB7ZMY2_9ERIC|nr:hypothetical protein Vadar_027352 [Vaccinium darrowii]